MPKLLTDYRLQQRDYLLKIARVMNGRLDLPEVLGLVIRYAVEMTNGQGGVIALRQGEEQNLKIMASYQLEEKYIHRLEPLLEQVPLSTLDGYLAPWQNSALDSDAQPLSKRLSEELEQVLMLPLVNQGETRGILFIFRSEGAALFTPINSQLLNTFAEQAAVAIQNASLYATVTGHARELHLLYDFSVRMASASNVNAALQVAAQYAAAIGPSQWVTILCSDEAAEEMTHCVLHSTTGETLDTQTRVKLEIESWMLLHESKPVFFSSEQNDLPDFLQEAGFSAAVAVPILGPPTPSKPSQGGNLGVLWVASRELEQYTTEMVRLLLTMVHYLGLTLDKFALIGRLEARERLLSTVIENNPAGVLLLNEAGQVLLQNPIVQALTGVESGEATAVHVNQVLNLEDEARLPLELPLPRGADAVTVQGYLRHQDGSRGRYLQASVTALMGGAGGHEGYVVNIVDLTALKEAEDAKRVFLAGLSHELKTPLALIRGYAETLRYPQLREDEILYQEALDVILDETTHLTKMVDQLLLAARLQAGALELKWHEVAIGPFIERIVETFRHAHPDYDWQALISEPLIIINADPTRLREVFQNLLSNAVKYSNPGTQISITVEPTAAGVRISIKDEGIGIAAEDQKRLFQRFFRASNHIEGTGLGLYMSQAIIEAHNGTIRAESVIGQGSTFIVELLDNPQKNSYNQEEIKD